VRFPVNALKYIFDKYKIKRNEIESVCFYEDLQLKYDRVNTTFFKNFLECPLEVSKSLIKTKINHWKLKRELKKISDNIFFSKHHDSHIFYSYYSSPFNDAVILSVDGVGEWETMSVGYVSDGDFKIVPLAGYPHSVGLFYSAMTSFIGFKPNEGEYKLMGLAAYGNPEKYRSKINQLIAHNCASLKTNMVYFSWDRDCLMFNEELIELMGIENRLPEEPITQDHMDIAASVQEKYEQILFEVLKDIQLFTNSNNLALAGGCAYNGTANGKITDNTNFKRLWIPPAPSDAGSCIGTCLNYFHTQKRPIKIHTDAFLGPEYNEVDIFRVISKTKGINYKKYQLVHNLNRKVSEEILDGKIIGWYQGKIEFGARALGNRSILANPTLPDMKDRINRVIKKREGFRPFAPMVTFEDQKQYFDYGGFVPYMNQVVKVKPKYRDKLLAVTHVDGTARIQSVTPFNPIYRLLKEYENHSGYPILLNTSFNVKDRTMVLTPQDAMDTFLNTEMDILVLGNYLIRKV